MSTFDNPFDPDRSLRSNGCSCGRHVSEAEHEAAAQLQIQASLESEQKRYEGVVASAVMRAMFPRDVARRAFLKSVGAATAAASLSHGLGVPQVARSLACHRTANLSRSGNVQVTRSDCARSRAIRVRGNIRDLSASREPLTPTLSPQAGRGR